MKPFRMMRSCLFAVVGGVALMGVGCETVPTQIEGRRVVGVRYVDGIRVYLVESKVGDRVEIIAVAADSADAARGIVFRGTKDR